MYQWYEIPIDYNDKGGVQPKYSDGYGITYFGDKPFNGYSGTRVGNKYIVKIGADREIHLKLQEKTDVVKLSNKIVENKLNSVFMQKYPFYVWDEKFSI